MVGVQVPKSRPRDETCCPGSTPSGATAPPPVAGAAEAAGASTATAELATAVFSAAAPRVTVTNEVAW